jgi:hypothetical protein
MWTTWTWPTACGGFRAERDFTGFTRHRLDQREGRIVKSGTLRQALIALLVVFAIETGLLLLMVPWSEAWQQNYFLQQLPSLRTWVMAPLFRGAISGLGILDLWFATGELNHFRRI